MYRFHSLTLLPLPSSSTMLGKRQRSVIGKLSELFVSGSRAALFDPAATTSPRGPLDPRALHSTRGPKSYDLGGVGLGIVAALETSDTAGRCLCRSRITASSNQSLDCFDVSENYTYVTCYGPNCQSFTKVYYSGGEYLGGGLTEPTLGQEAVAERPPFPATEFLRSCNSCKKKLHGEDVYIYRCFNDFIYLSILYSLNIKYIVF